MSTTEREPCQDPECPDGWGPLHFPAGNASHQHPVSQIPASATTGMVCRNCRKKLTFRGMFWADENGDLYCHTAHGQHVAVAKEPEKK